MLQSIFHTGLKTVINFTVLVDIHSCFLIFPFHITSTQPFAAHPFQWYLFVLVTVCVFFPVQSCVDHWGWVREMVFTSLIL